MDIRKLLLPFSLLFVLSSTAKAEDAIVIAEQMTMTDSSYADTATVKKRSWVNRFLDYFNDANKNKKHKKFDFSVIGGPHYSTDTELGLGLVAAGLYRTCQTDTLLPPSNVSLYGDFIVHASDVFHKMDFEF